MRQLIILILLASSVSGSQFTTSTCQQLENLFWLIFITVPITFATMYFFLSLPQKEECRYDEAWKWLVILGSIPSIFGGLLVHNAIMLTNYPPDSFLLPAFLLSIAFVTLISSIIIIVEVRVCYNARKNIRYDLAHHDIICSISVLGALSLMLLLIGLVVIGPRCIVPV